MKNIFIVGGFSRNYGDFAIWNGQTKMLTIANEHLNLTGVNKDQLQFIPISSDISVDGSYVPQIDRDMVDMINHTGDMLMVGGGGMIMSRGPKDRHSGWQFNIPEHLLEKITVPLVVYGIGLNEFPDEDILSNPAILRHLLATYWKSDLFSVRNQGTKNRLGDVSLGSIVADVIPDPGMFCNGYSVALPNQPTGPLIGFCWAGDRQGRRYKDDIRYDVAEQLAKAAKRHDGTIVYIPHVSAYDFDDMEFFRTRIGTDRFYNLADHLPSMYPERLCCVPLLAGVYSQMSVVVGSRAHSNIIPFGEHVPFISLGPHVKNTYFAESVNMPVDRSGRDLAYRIDTVLESRDEFTERMTNQFYLFYNDLFTYNQKVLGLLYGS